MVGTQFFVFFLNINILGGLGSGFDFGMFVWYIIQMLMIYSKVIVS